MRHIERARAASAGDINPELTRGARFHLIKSHGWIGNWGPLAIAMEDIHDEEAAHRREELRKTAGTGIRFDNLDVNNKIATRNETLTGASPFTLNRHQHPEKINLPPIE